MTQSSDAPTPRNGENEPRTAQPEASTPLSATGGQPAAKDAVNPKSKPQGSFDDQVKTMESEGQAQPQADEVPPDDHPKSIPPLPEPDVEGVGNERGPSADKTGDTIARERAKQGHGDRR